MLHIRKRLITLLRAASHPSTSSPSSYLHLSTSATATPFSAEDYLVGTCGLTGAQALKASKKLSHLKSASKPDAVLALLSGVGFSRPDIAAVVATDPLLLCSRVDNMARRLSSLRDRLGLSDPQIARFLLVGGATALRSCDIAPKLEFLIPFFGSFDKLLQSVKGNCGILTADLERVVKRNIALLRECGLSVCDIVRMLTASRRLLSFNPERVKAIVLRAEKLGLPHTSYAFKYAVVMLSRVTEDKVAAMIEFLRSTLGCSKDKLGIAVCKHPQILGLSEEKLRCTIEFLRSTLGCSKDKLGAAFCKQPQILALSEENLRLEKRLVPRYYVVKVGLEPEYIVERPLLLKFSLEKRLVPRYYVVKVLVGTRIYKSETLCVYCTSPGSR